MFVPERLSRGAIYGYTVAAAAVATFEGFRFRSRGPGQVEAHRGAIIGALLKSDLDLLTSTPLDFLAKLRNS